jgi:hypothetical protein
MCVEESQFIPKMYSKQTKQKEAITTPNNALFFFFFVFLFARVPRTKKPTNAAMLLD